MALKRDSDELNPVEDKGLKRLQCGGSGEGNGEGDPDSPQVSGPASKRQRIWDFATTDSSEVTFLRRENSKLRKLAEEYKQEMHAAKNTAGDLRRGNNTVERLAAAYREIEIFEISNACTTAFSFSKR